MAILPSQEATFRPFIFKINFRAHILKFVLREKRYFTVKIYTDQIYHVKCKRDINTQFTILFSFTFESSEKHDFTKILLLVYLRQGRNFTAYYIALGYK